MGIKKLVVAAMSAGVIMSVASVASLADSNTGWRDIGQGDWRYFVSDEMYILRTAGNRITSSGITFILTVWHLKTSGLILKVSSI